jgi:hypothetical protein
VNTVVDSGTILESDGVVDPRTMLEDDGVATTPPLLLVSLTGQMVV